MSGRLRGAGLLQPDFGVCAGQRPGGGECIGGVGWCPGFARKEHAGTSVLALHLLQSALVHVDTLLVQQVVAEPARPKTLSDEDRRGLTALFWSNVNAYGTFHLDVNKRLNLETTAAVSRPRTFADTARPSAEHRAPMSGFSCLTVPGRAGCCESRISRPAHIVARRFVLLRWGHGFPLLRLSPGTAPAAVSAARRPFVSQGKSYA
ncbi:Tn3 family transposase [Streptomyces sp. NPDC002054]|uniref:Tn3 family transposase n=1 Tax=Streptomyces sp. NPDC002054 TaxID=3154663 RepID=UPI00332D9B92